MAMDIANYLNECCLENAYPKGVGINCYLENFPTNYECNMLMKSYLKYHYQAAQAQKPTDEKLEAYLERALPKFRQEVENCCLLNNFYWGVWALLLIRDNDVCDEKVFNYEFAISRVKIYKLITQVFGKSKVSNISTSI